MANKITVLLDLATDKATSAARGFKASIAEAEGATNKFKAGASSAFASVQAASGALALGAGAAIAGFGVKAVQSFESGALAAGKFSEATGLAVEDASRLGEVAGDLGVSSDAVAGTVTKLQKAVASNSAAVKELGIETKTTADGQTDVLATYLDAIDKLGGVEDANKKALLASQLFGKGFADSAEIVLANADDLKARLDSVSDAQVFNSDEVENARKLRDGMEDLKDEAQSLSLTLGGVLVPALAGVVGGLNDTFEGARRLGQDIGAGLAGPGAQKLLAANRAIVESFQDSQDAARNFDRGLIANATSFADVREAVIATTGDVTAANIVALEWARTNRDAAKAVDDHGDAVADLGDKAANSGPKIGDMAGALDDVNAALKKTADEGAQKFQDALQGVLDKVDEVAQGVRDRINMEGLLDDITAQFRAVQQAGEDAAENGKEGTAQYREEVRRLRLMILDLLGDLDNLSANDKIRLSTEIERGSLDDLFKILGELSKGVTVPVVFGTPQQAFSGVQASIASNAVPNMSFVNPNPAPINNSQTTINFPVGSSPTTTAIDQRLYATRNGPR